MKKSTKPRNKKNKATKAKKFSLDWVPSLPFSRKTLRLILFVLLFANIGTYFLLFAAASGLDVNAENDQFNRINQERSSRNIKTLPRSGCLTDAAREWSTTMAQQNKLYHSNVSNLVNKHCKSGGSWSMLAENVGRGPNSKSIFDAFMKSSGHRSNILNTNFNLVGTGAYMTSSGALYVTQLFARCVGCSGDWTRSPSAINTTTSTTSTEWSTTVSGDWNGNGINGHAFYDRSTGRWVVYSGSSNGTLGTKMLDTSISKGWDNIVTGDWNGNGVDGYAFYRRSDGRWLVYTGRTDGRLGTQMVNTTISKGWDLITAGDWNGNGIDGYTFYRRSDGRWLVYAGRTDGRLGSLLNSQTISKVWTQNTAGDWNNNGIDGHAFYRRSDGLWLVYAGRTNGTLGTNMLRTNISSGWDSITAGDWNNNGIDGYTFYRRSDGRWLVYAGRTDGRLGSQLNSQTISNL